MSGTDYELLMKWVERSDASAFKELADRHAPMVFSVCRRMLGSSTEAEDVAQECFEALLRKGGEPGRYLGAWLHRVAVNLAAKRLRSETRRRERETRYAPESDSSEASWDDIFEHIDAAVAELPDKLRLPVVLHFYENRTHDAIARELGVSRTAITYRITQGVERIRKALRQQGVIIGAAAITGLLIRELPAQAAPLTLTTSLAKFALAGPTVVPGAGSITGFLLGGVAMSKTAILGTVLVILALFAAWRLFPSVPQVSSAVVAPSQTTTEQDAVASSDSNAQSPSAVEAKTESPDPASQRSASQGATLASVAGRAYFEETGKPVPGLAIYLVPQGGTDEKRIRLVTDADGRYLFEGLAAGSYELNYDLAAAEAMRGVPLPPDVGTVVIIRATPDSAVQQVDLPIRIGLRVTGRVVDKQGRPVAGADVEGRDSTDNRSLEQCFSRDDGSFELVGFKQTPALTLESRLTGSQGKSALVGELYGPVALGPEGLSDVQLTLRPGGRLSGKLVDSKGKPVVDAVMRTYPLRGKVQRTMGHANVHTGKDGSFNLDGIAPGVNDLMVNYGKWTVLFKPVPPWDKVEVSSGQEITNAVVVVEFPETEPSSSISGRVVDTAKRPLEDIHVWAWSPSPPCSSDACTEKDGAFCVKNLMPGAYRLEIKERLSGGKYGTRTLESVDSGTEELEIVLPSSGAVAGHVLNADGAPVREFEILCMDERKRQETGADRKFIRQRSEDGSFHLEGVEPGPCVVTAKVTGSSPTSVEMPMVKSGETIKGVVVRLIKGAVVTGVVVDKKGQLLPNVGVFPGEAPESEMPESVIATRTDSKGAFRLTGLAQETTVITAYHSDYAIVSIPVKLNAGGESAVKLIMTEGGIIEGTVYYDDKLWPGRRVRLHAGRADNEYGVSTMSSETGAFRFDKVRVGQASMVLFAPASPERGSPNDRMQVRIVDISVGKITRYDFHFAPATSSVEGTVTSNGTPISDSRTFLALVYTTTEGYESFNTKVGADGKYRFPNVIAGPATLRVNTPSTEFTLDLNIPAGETVHQDIEVNTAAVR